MSGLYTALSGPGGASYYDPLTGVGMAREQAAAANEYSDNLNAIEPALHKAFVDVAGVVPGPVGAVGAGLIETEITYIETGNAGEALKAGGTRAAVGLAFNKLGDVVGGRLTGYLARRLAPEAATVVAGAETKAAVSGGLGGDKNQRGFFMLPGGRRYLYRGLADGEDISSGISARAPNAIGSPAGHVIGLKASPFISATKDITIATGKYGNHGAVRIDLSKLPSNTEVIDISKGIGTRGRTFTWPRRDKEFLIRGYIPPEAITKIK